VVGDLNSGRTYTTLTYGQSYHHGNWTIYPDQSGTRFVNDGTGHGMFGGRGLLAAEPVKHRVIGAGVLAGSGAE
jgi:hypothetical protein